MNGFFVLNVPEFRSLISAAAGKTNCKVHPLVDSYYFIEFDNDVEILRSETEMKDAVWFGCMTAGLIGKIATFDVERIRLVATNEPIILSQDAKAST